MPTCGYLRIFKIHLAQENILHNTNYYSSFQFYYVAFTCAEQSDELCFHLWLKLKVTHGRFTYYHNMSFASAVPLKFYNQS